MAVYRTAQLPPGENEQLSAARMGSFPDSIPAVKSLNFIASAGLLLEGKSLNFEPAIRFSQYRASDANKAWRNGARVQRRHGRSEPDDPRMADARAGELHAALRDPAFNQAKSIAVAVLQANF